MSAHGRAAHPVHRVVPSALPERIRVHKKPLPPPATGRDVLDVLDRLFRKGIVIENLSTTSADGAPADKLQVSVAAIHLVRTHATVPWRVPPKAARKKN